MPPPICDHIVQIAGELFYREGIRAVGIDRIVQEADVAKATLYKYFPSKEDLIEAYLSDRHRNVLSAMTGALARKPATASAQVGALFDMLVEKSRSIHFRGCAFLLAIAEYGQLESVVGISRQHKAAVREIFRRVTELEYSRDTADQLALIYEGALATVAVEGGHDAVLLAKRCAVQILRASQASTDVEEK